MNCCRDLLKTEHPVNPAPADAARLAEELSRACELEIYPGSIILYRGKALALGRDGATKQAVLLSATGEGRAVAGCGAGLKAQPLGYDARAAAAVRAAAPFLAPGLVGSGSTSMGLGDRLGVATPGHLRAVRGTGVTPIIAQQSIREMERTGRTPQQVMDCATLGALEAGWIAGFGSDADHLKSAADVDYTMPAGFTMFTIDPREHVDNGADALPEAELRKKYAALPWKQLEATGADTLARYTGRKVDLGGSGFSIGEAELLRAAVKYGRAVAHTVGMYRYVADKAGGRPFEFEMSVDETDSPTTTVEHYYFASELTRLGAKWSSLAPRFIGEFEKGVDYIGDLKRFEQAYVEHCKVAETFGNYKISVHSGSDKFSIYAICARHAKGRIHVKTAGTSYLEALRTLACVDAPLFREILAYAVERYDEDRKSYHVSAVAAKVLRPEKCRDADLPAALDHFDTREALHVTFGSVLTADGGERFKKRMLAALAAHEEKHYEILSRHIRRHLEPMLAR